MLNQIICRFLNHQFGDWHPSDDDLCKEVRVCSRCNYAQEVVSHDWGNWNPVDDKYHIRVCHIDKESERDYHHFPAGIRCSTCDGEGSYKIEGGYSSSGRGHFSTVTCEDCEGSGYEKLPGTTCELCGYIKAA